MGSEVERFSLQYGRRAVRLLESLPSCLMLFRFPSSDTMMVSNLPKEVPLFSLSKEVRGGNGTRRGGGERGKSRRRRQIEGCSCFPQRLVANVDAMLAEIEQADMSRRTDVFRSSAGLSHLNARVRRSSLLDKLGK